MNMQIDIQGAEAQGKVGWALLLLNTQLSMKFDHHSQHYIGLCLSQSCFAQWSQTSTLTLCVSACNSGDFKVALGYNE